MKKIFFDSTDGLKLCAIHENNESDICVVLCHGIRGNKEEVGNFTKLVDRLNNMKIDSFRFDFRGHGESEGEFINVTITKEVEDLESALNYINRFNYEKIILLGASFGGISVSLLNYRKYNNIKGLILWYPALRIENTDLFTNEQYEEAKLKGYTEIWNTSRTKSFKLGLELMKECRSLRAWKAIEDVNIHKIFIHGDSDSNVDIKANSIEPSKNSPNSKLVIIKDGVHNFSRVDENLVKEGIKETIEFIETM